MRLDLDVKYVRDQIIALLLAHPELVEDEVLREDMIEGSTTTFEFLSKIVRLIGENGALFEGTSLYIQELLARKGRLVRREEALRSFIFKIMLSADLSKVQLPEATLSIRDGQPKVIITDEHLILDQYCRIRREPDKIAIKEVLASGGIISGAELSNSPPSLSIRIK